MTTFGRAAVIGAAVYLVVLAFGMQRWSYDLWGGLVIVPVLTALSAPLIRRAFSGDLAVLRPAAWLGLGVKFAGAMAGYFVRFDSYGGSADANRYHQTGKVLAGSVWNGERSPWSLIPFGTGTSFLEELTGLVYTVFGSSKLGGFIVFSWMSYWGLVLFVKAAVLAVPGLARQRYALALFLFPSLIYWGSSIGKEAFVGLCLGAGAYGIAVLLTRDRHWPSGLMFTAAGLYGASRVRPHFAAIWLGAAVIAMIGRTILELSGRGQGGTGRFRIATLGLAAATVIGFVMIATVTLDQLAPADYSDLATAPDVSAIDRLSTIFDKTTEQTTQGGSSFTPVDNSNLPDWPYAAYRTLSRPLLTEADGLAELLPAIEMTALFVVGVFGWRRLLHTPKLLLSVPYVLFALVALFTFGVAFASIGNLGLLVRQRSLVLPLLLLFWCLPPLPERATRALALAEARTNGRIIHPARLT